MFFSFPFFFLFSIYLLGLLQHLSFLSFGSATQLIMILQSLLGYLFWRLHAVETQTREVFSVPFFSFIHRLLLPFYVFHYISHWGQCLREVWGRTSCRRRLGCDWSIVLCTFESNFPQLISLWCWKFENFQITLKKHSIASLKRKR